MDDPPTPLVIGDDGEIQGLPMPDKPKKLPPSARRRAIRRLVIFLGIAFPVAACAILATLVADGRLDVTGLPIYRRLCVATLGKPRLAYSWSTGTMFGASTLNMAQTISGGAPPLDLQQPFPQQTVPVQN